MHRLLARGAACLAALLLVAPALADPPAQAPAHGWRNKHKQYKHHHDDHHHRGSGDHGHATPGGFRVVFDPERGIEVAVGFPGVVFHGDHFYRMHEGLWQRSARADGGWLPLGPDAAPSAIRKALPMPPGPAKLAPGDATKKGRSR